MKGEDGKVIADNSLEKLVEASKVPIVLKSGVIRIEDLDQKIPTVIKEEDHTIGFHPQHSMSPESKK